MAKNRKKVVKQKDTTLPSPAEVTKITAEVTGQTTAGKYATKVGRERFNTMMHPELITALKNEALSRDVTLPYLIEEIVSAYLKIDPPSKRR